MTANQRAGNWALRAGLSLLGFAAGGCRGNEVTGGTASTMVVIAGADQQATVGTAVATPPSVRVLDATGSPMAGVTVKFTVTGGGGTDLGDSPVTDANGLATVGSWILGTNPGANTMKAQLSTGTVSTTIKATGVVGTGVSIRVSGQTGFVALVGQQVTPTPAVVVVDSYGNPVPGIAVTFTVVQGSGTITGAQATTNSSGIAQLGSWTLSITSGINRLTARAASGASLTFTAQAVTSAPVLTATTPQSQTGFVSFPVTNVPRVMVTDAGGTPLQGVPVKFTVTAGNGVVSNGDAVSDVAGIAAPNDWRLGLTPTSVLTATSGLGALPVTFSATGTVAPFLIDVRFLTTMNADQRDAFVAAARRWMRIITAHLTPVTVNLPAGACATLQPALNEQITDVVIFASVTAIDGAGNILGDASPCATRSISGLPVVGTMEFDSADLAVLVSTNQLVPAITHEMGHVLGFGTIWTDVGVATGIGGSDPIFTGTNALALWPPFGTALGYTGHPVPLENNGVAGTDGSHWRESVFHAELMTGYIEAPGHAMPLSRMTIASMADLGYTVDYTQADAFVGNLMASSSGASPATRIQERLRKPIWEVSTLGGTQKRP